MFPNLFKPVTIGPLKVPNRIVMPPMTTRYANIDGTVNERIKQYYKARAAGGAGLIIAEMACVTRDQRGMSRQLAIWGDEFIPGLKELAEAIHSAGSLCFLQLQHAGREAFNGSEKDPPVAPSSVPGSVRQGPTAREMTIPEIEGLVQDFAAAAVRAQEAGFDGVEFHGAHIYLIQQFLSPLTNRRKDKYGDDVDGRTRFAVDILQESRRRLGSEFPICVRINGSDFIEGGTTLEHSTRTAKLLQEAGATCIHVSGGTVGTGKMVPRASEDDGCLVFLAEGIKQAIDIPVITVGKIKEPALAEKILSEGKADMVAMGRTLIADPELPRKAREGRISEIEECLSCKTCHNGPGGEVACNVNPTAGIEYEAAVR